jgi:hypothetical protein
MEHRFFFLINFFVSLLLFVYCLVIIPDTRAFYFSMFYLLNVIGAFIGFRLNTQPAKFRTVNLITGIAFPLIIAAIVINLSRLSVQTLFAQLVIFTTLTIIGLGFSIYLYHNFRRKRNS